jgi:hypothetical protein
MHSCYLFYLLMHEQFAIIIKTFCLLKISNNEAQVGRPVPERFVRRNTHYVGFRCIFPPMKSLLSPAVKFLLAFVCTGAAVLGFMLKLPAGFRHIDKELHSLFYFLAAAFFNLLFVQRNLLKHVLVFVLLYLFGAGIERAQEYSNRYFRARIHGRYDPEDVQANLNGLLAFSGLWMIVVILLFLFRKKEKDTL